MTEQPGLFDVARARNRIDREGRLTRDPSTSFDAARSQTPERLSAVQRSVYSTMVLARRPLSDEELIERVKRDFGNIASSSIRSRRKELCRKGLVEAVPGEYGLTHHGQRCHLWRIVERDRGPSTQGASP